MPFRILIADDKIDDRGEEISELPELLRRAGYEIRTSADADRAWDLFWDYRPDLVVLDIMFGNHPAGVEFCANLRRSEDETPVILVTRFRKETREVLAGFEAGTDDYVILPCDNLEIMARIRANLPPEAVIVDDYLQVDFAGRRVWIHREEGWDPVRLSRRLWELLDVLMLNAGITVVTTTIKERVWGKAVDDNLLFRAVFDLRKKLEPDPRNPIYIEGIRGIGYQFNGTLLRAGAMPLNKTLRAQLMAQASGAVDRLLAEKSPDLQPSDAARLARAAGQYVEEHFTRVLVGE